MASLLSVENLQVQFQTKKGINTAVDGVSFSVKKGRILGIVGESGCGKSTLGRTLLKIYEPDGGSIYFDGNDITSFGYKQMPGFPAAASNWMEKN